MKNEFNVNITEINQHEMSLSSIFDTIIEKIEKQFIEEVNPQFVYLVQQLSKKKLYKNDEFKLKKKINKCGNLQYKIKYRTLLIKFEIHSEIYSNTGHHISYLVKDSLGHILRSGYQYEVFPNPKSLISPNVYKRNLVDSITYPTKTKRIDLFIRMIDNLDTFLSRNDDDSINDDYIRVDTIKKKDLRKLILENTFSGL